MPGLVERVVASGWTIDTFGHFSTLPEDPGVLAENDVPKRIRQAVGGRMVGIKRNMIVKALLDHAEAEGVSVKWGHKLVAIEQFEGHVKVKFANGAEETASFVVGCDGLYSTTRACLFGNQPPDFTGLIQVSP